MAAVVAKWSARRRLWPQWQSLRHQPDQQPGDGIRRDHRRFHSWICLNIASGDPGALSLPRDLAFGPDGNLYVASFGSGDVFRYNGSTGAFMDDFIPADTGDLHGPTFLLFGESSSVTTPEPSTLWSARLWTGSPCYVETQDRTHQRATSLGNYAIRNWRSPRSGRASGSRRHGDQSSRRTGTDWNQLNSG